METTLVFYKTREKWTTQSRAKQLGLCQKNRRSGHEGLPGMDEYMLHPLYGRPTCHIYALWIW